MNARDFHRFTRLMQAAKLAEKAAAELLPTSGVDVKSPSRPLTALVLAQTAGHVDIADLLRKNGAKK